MSLESATTTASPSRKKSRHTVYDASQVPYLSDEFPLPSELIDSSHTFTFQLTLNCASAAELAKFRKYMTSKTAWTAYMERQLATIKTEFDTLNNIFA